MTLLHAIILGIVQGLTEFLPVSSSGHLALIENLFGLSGGNLRFEVFVHLGTLAAVVVVFRKRISKLVRAVFKARVYSDRGRLRFTDDNLRLALLLVLATIPAAVIGLLFDDAIERAFQSPVAVSALLLATGAILFGTRFVRAGEKKMNWWRALLVGCAQAVAILPGISRSGSTICAGIYAGTKQEDAAEFSFLLSVPVILGAGLLKFKDALHQGIPAGELLNLAAGGLAAAAVGYVSIKLLLGIVRRRKLEYFAYYCWAAGLAGLAWFLTR
ncbi:MAG: undecaprenyl-diphosphate phosphatase [Candidatus Edwardsbacteria bacterium]|jgi:undecaprenyl-diphosphatase|nr:undecaprenyl-diphosphate phosphatase [Candidatus Edwardsbacteria bacterium]